MQINKTQITMALVILILIAVLSLRECSHRKQSATAAMQISSLTDTVRITKDRMGRQTARINTIIAQYSDFRHWHFAQSDSLGRLLQREVNARTINAILATQQVKIAVKLPTTETMRGANASKSDSSCGDADSCGLSADTCHPRYTLRFDPKDPYRKGAITAGADSFDLNISFPEQLTFTTEAGRWRLFKPTTYTSRYTNSNPYVEISGLRTYTVMCDCQTKSMISFGFGGLVGLAGGFAFGRLFK